MTQEKSKNSFSKWLHHFKDGFLGGLGWSFGVTVGFVLISALIAFAVNTAGGLPLIGEWVAEIVAVTQESLDRNPYYRD